MLCFKKKSKETRLLFFSGDELERDPEILRQQIYCLKFSLSLTPLSNEAQNENDKHQTLSEHPFFTRSVWSIEKLKRNFIQPREFFGFSFSFTSLRCEILILKGKSIKPKGAIKLKEKHRLWKLSCENLSEKKNKENDTLQTKWDFSCTFASSFASNENDSGISFSLFNCVKFPAASPHNNTSHFSHPHFQMENWIVFHSFNLSFSFVPSLLFDMEEESVEKKCNKLSETKFIARKTPVERKAISNCFSFSLFFFISQILPKWMLKNFSSAFRYNFSSSLHFLNEPIC